MLPKGLYLYVGVRVSGLFFSTVIRLPGRTHRPRPLIVAKKNIIGHHRHRSSSRSDCARNFKKALCCFPRPESADLGYPSIEYTGALKRELGDEFCAWSTYSADSSLAEKMFGVKF